MSTCKIFKDHKLFLVVENFTRARLFQIAWEKLCDCLYLAYLQTPELFTNWLYLASKNTEIILMGDINIDLIKFNVYQLTSDFLDMLYSNFAFL